MASCRCASGTGSPLTFGRLTGTPLTSAGTTTMKMISRTRHTSTSGVTLMLDSSVACERTCMANPPARFDTHAATERNRTTREAQLTDNRQRGASAPKCFNHSEHPAGWDHALDFISTSFQQRCVFAGGAFAAAEH